MSAVLWVKRAAIIIITVGYTMRDIRYKWNEGPNSVGVSKEVSLPQFKVLGHRQRAMEISLTTGTQISYAWFSVLPLYLQFSHVEKIHNTANNTCAFLNIRNRH